MSLCSTPLSWLDTHDHSMARAIIDFGGEPPSKATLLKVIGNTFVLSMVETLAEGHVIAEKSGLGVENLQRFLEVMFPGPYMAYSKRLSSGEYYNRPEVSQSSLSSPCRTEHGHSLSSLPCLHVKMPDMLWALPEHQVST